MKKEMKYCWNCFWYGYYSDIYRDSCDHPEGKNHDIGFRQAPPNEKACKHFTQDPWGYDEPPIFEG